MIIRRAESRDIPELLRLLRQVLEVHAALRPDLFRSGSTKYTADELEAILRDESRPVYAAVGEGGALAGYAFCQLQEQPSAGHLRPFRRLYLDDLCVDESARRQHVGRQLFDYVKKEASRLGCYEITLHVWQGNAAAEAFYEKMGMQIKMCELELVLPD